MKRLCAVLITCLLGLAACNDAATPPPSGADGPAATPETPGTPADRVEDQARPVGMAVAHAPLYPTRLAVRDGRTYVSDARVGAIFVFDQNMKAVAELKGLDAPLGVAVDAAGRIYVGSDGRDAVDVFDAKGALVATIGEGTIRMPNDLAIDEAGNLYVVDSRSDVVLVFDAEGRAIATIGGSGDGAGQLRFPSAVAVTETEVFVADQGHFRVQVYDRQGNHLRSFGESVEAFTNDWHGRFVKLQGLAIDAQGRVHAVDSYLKNVQILDARTGDYVDSYAVNDSGEGTLTLPLDIALSATGDALVTNAESRRVETFRAVATALPTEGE